MSESRKVYTYEQLIEIGLKYHAPNVKMEDLVKSLDIYRPCLVPRADAYKPVAPSTEQEVQQKQITRILNKLTPEKYDELAPQLVDAFVTLTILPDFLGLLFSKASTEYAFCSMYASLANDIRKNLQQAHQDPGASVVYEVALADRCCSECETAVKGLSSPDPDVATDSQALKKSIGACVFAAELLVKGLVSDQLVCDYLLLLLHVQDTALCPLVGESEASCKMLQCAGPYLENNENFTSIMDRVLQLSRTHPIPRCRFMMLDVVEMQRKNWQLKYKKGPKKLDEGNNFKQVPVDVSLLPVRDETPLPTESSLAGRASSLSSSIKPNGNYKRKERDVFEEEDESTQEPINKKSKTPTEHMSYKQKRELWSKMQQEKEEREKAYQEMKEEAKRLAKAGIKHLNEDWERGTKVLENAAPSPGNGNHYNQPNPTDTINNSNNHRAPVRHPMRIPTRNVYRAPRTPRPVYRGPRQGQGDYIPTPPFRPRPGHYAPPQSSEDPSSPISPPPSDPPSYAAYSRRSAYAL